MRIFIAACILSLLPAARAAADMLVATRPGLMCSAPEALAILTLPDGSSRAASPRVRPGDMEIKQLGGCLDIPLGARVAVQTTRKNTSIVTYDPADEHGARTFIVPNIDFGIAPHTRTIEGSGSLFRKSRDPALSFYSAVAERCPWQRWERAPFPAFDGPLRAATESLTLDQRNMLHVQSSRDCQEGIGLSCGHAVTIRFLVRVGHLQELVRAFCTQQVSFGQK